MCRKLVAKRSLLDLALRGDQSALAALSAEQESEREADRRYWEPLRRELEMLRRMAGGKKV